MQATIGRIVTAIVEPTRNNGNDVCPAVLTRVWGEASIGGEHASTVNARLLLDQPEVGWATTVPLFDGEDQARAYLSEGGSAPGRVAAFWPARV